MRTTILLCLLSFSTIVKAQELKKITKANNHFGEVYYVLKSDKNIRHGQYLKYFESMNMYDKSIEVYGNYDNNKKTGAWIYCDAENVANPLLAIGEFKDNKKVGKWVYFYIPDSESDNIINLFGGKKHTTVTLPKGNDLINVSLDTIGIRTAAIGECIDNKKVGVWNYYFKNGSLACKYDFTYNTMIYNNGLKSFDQLGSLERFKSLFHKSVFEKRINNQPFFVQNSNVIFELTTIHDSISIQKISSIGSTPFAKTMEDILYKMSADWINYDPRAEQNKIKIQINYIVDGKIGTVTIDSIKPLN
jgi:hypothetical protein